MTVRQETENVVLSDLACMRLKTEKYGISGNSESCTEKSSFFSLSMRFKNVMLILKI